MDGVRSGSGKRSKLDWSKNNQSNASESFNINNVGGVEELGNARGGISSSQNVSPAEKVSQSAAASKADQVEKTPFQTVRRQMNSTDVIDQLILMKVAPNKENQHVLLTMIQYGIEATSDNLELINRLKRGKKNPNAVESAVIAVSKGLTQSIDGVDLLEVFMQNQVKVSQQMQALENALSKFQGLLLQYGDIFDKGLHQGISSIIGKLVDELERAKDILNKETGELKGLKRGEMVQNLVTFQDFMEGILSQLAQLKLEDRSLPKSIHNVNRKVTDLLDSFTSQLILSKASEKQIGIQEDYSYWQIPNPLTQYPSNMDILIQKEPNNKKAKVNPKDTKIMVKLETENMGEVGIEATVTENKVFFVIESDKTETRESARELSAELKDEMAAHNYEVLGFRTVKRRPDIKKKLLPTVNLNDISRIQTEV